MKKILSLILVMILLTISMTSCFNSGKSYGRDYAGLGVPPWVYAKLTSEKRFFENDNVTFDISIGIRDRSHFSEEQRENYKSIVYVTNMRNLSYLISSNNYTNVENIEGAKALLVLSYDEARNFTYTIDMDYLGRITYHHSEKITIPKEFVNSNNDTLYIHVVEFACFNIVDEDDATKNTLEVIGECDIVIEYQAIGNYVILT